MVDSKHALHTVIHVGDLFGLAELIVRDQTVVSWVANARWRNWYLITDVNCQVFVHSWQARTRGHGTANRTGVGHRGQMHSNNRLHSARYRV